MYELKSCPFCGEQPSYKWRPTTESVQQSGHMEIHMLWCGTSLLRSHATQVAWTREGVVAKWNMRTPDGQPELCPFCGRQPERWSRGTLESEAPDFGPEIHFTVCCCGSQTACAYQRGRSAEEVAAKWRTRWPKDRRSREVLDEFSDYVARMKAKVEAKKERGV